MSGWLARFRERRGGARGATLVEYALMAALIAVVLIGALQAVTDSASDELSDRGGGIGHPSQATGVVTTTTAGPVVTTTSSTTTTSTTLVTYTIQKSCAAPAGNSNECTFSLTPAPVGTVVWAIHPPSGWTGTLPTVTFNKKGSRTVQATVDGAPVTPLEVECVETGGDKWLQC